MVIRSENATKPTTFLHQIRTFGETLYRAGRIDERCSISIEDIDQATDQLTVNVKSSAQVLKARAMINQLLAGCGKTENFVVRASI